MRSLSRSISVMARRLSLIDPTRPITSTASTWLARRQHLHHRLGNPRGDGGDQDRSGWSGSRTAGSSPFSPSTTSGDNVRQFQTATSYLVRYQYPPASTQGSYGHPLAGRQGHVGQGEGEVHELVRVGGDDHARLPGRRCEDGARGGQRPGVRGRRLGAIVGHSAAQHHDRLVRRGLRAPPRGDGAHRRSPPCRRRWCSSAGSVRR